MSDAAPMKLHNTMTPDEEEALNKHLGERERRSRGDETRELPASSGSEIERELMQLLAIQPKQIRDLLIRHALVDAAAIEDPEGYDGFRTWDSVNRFALELQRTLFPND